MSWKLGASLLLVGIVVGSLAWGCQRTPNASTEQPSQHQQAAQGSAGKDAAQLEADSASERPGPVVRPYDPRPERPPSETKEPDPTPRQVIALPPVPIPQKQLEPEPLALPDRKIPTYPDGAWQFLSWSESFGLPLGVRKVEPGAPLLRDHIEIRVEAGRIRSLHQLNAAGKLQWVRDFHYEEGDMFPRGFTQKDDKGAVVSMGRLLDNAARYQLNSTSGASLLDGCAELKRELDASGFVHSQTCLSRNQTPIPDRSGVVSVQFERQEMGLVTQRLNLGPDGRLTLDKDGVAITQYEYNLDAAVVKMTFLGLEKQPVRHTRYGCARIDFSWTSAGQLAAEKYYGLHDEPVAGTLGVYGILYAYDAAGRKIEETTVGIGGSPKPPVKAKASRLVWDFDDQGRVSRTTSFSPDGSAAPRATGFHMEKFEYLPSGEEVVACLNPSLNPVSCTHGTPGLKRERGADGRVVSESYLDGRGNAAAVKSPAGLSTLAYEWDPEGRLRRTVWSDRNGQPLRSLGGPSAMAYEYNDFGDIVLRTFVNAQGGPMDSSWGYATIRSTFDDWGRTQQVCVYSAAGQPAIAMRAGSPFQGFHCIRYEYQGTWYPARVRFLDALSTPVAVAWGDSGLVSHQCDLEWDPQGQLTRIVPAQPLPPPPPEPGTESPQVAPGALKPAPAPVVSPLSPAKPATSPATPGTPTQEVPLLPPPPLDCLTRACPNVQDVGGMLWP